MTLDNQAIGYKMQYSFSNMPICMLQVPDCLVSKDVWLVTLDDLTATFENSLPDNHFAV